MFLVNFINAVRSVTLISFLLFEYACCQSTELSPDVASCPDVEVTFTCQTPQGSSVLTWIVTLVRDGTALMGQPIRQSYGNNTMLGTVTVQREGISFHFSLVDTSPSVLSTMRTSLPLSMNGTRVECLPNTLIPSLTPDESAFLFIGTSITCVYSS